MSENNRNVNRPAAPQRDALLAELLVSMERIHRRRRTTRRTFFVMIPVVVGVLLTIFVKAPSHPTHVVDPRIAASQPQTPEHRTSIVRVTTDPSIIDRYRAASESRAVRIDDETLLTTLAQMNQPSGLIRSEGRVWLTHEPRNGS